MLLSMDSAVGALAQFQEQLNVTANNIANVNTVGFKSATVNFEQAFSQTVGTNGSGETMQVGTGVTTSSIQNQFTQGSLTNTGNPTNMAVTTANGFFIVKDPTTGDTYATRDGSFTVNSSGYLVNSSGMQVQGYTDSTLSTIGSIQVDTVGQSTTDASVTDTAKVTSVSFGTDGKLTETLADGTSITRGQVLLQNFTSPQQLTAVGGNLYSNFAAAGPLAAPVPPGSNGLGTIQTSTLEMSNVDLAGQLSSLISTQAAYQASSKVITTSNDILQTLINLKQG